MVHFPNPRSRPPYHMHDMILGQPDFVRETLRRMESADANAFLGRAKRILITGCGTSFHAAMYGARVLQAAAGAERVVEAVQAYDLLHGHPIPPESTVIAVSHSGNTSTTNQALAVARRSGARAVGLCGLSGTPLEDAAEDVLVIGSVHDHSWANTMSYTSQLAAFARIATQLNPAWDAEIERGLRALPSSLAKGLGVEGSVRQRSRAAARRRRITFLGSGLDDITALEGALKIRETCSLPASGYHVEQFLHGPFLSLDRDEAVVALRSRDDGHRERGILTAVERTGASLTIIGDGEGVDIRLPAIHRTLRPILSVIPFQFVAYHVALERRTNPDIMRSEVPRYRPGLERLAA